MGKPDKKAEKSADREAKRKLRAQNIEYMKQEVKNRLSRERPDGDYYDDETPSVWKDWKRIVPAVVYFIYAISAAILCKHWIVDHVNSANKALTQVEDVSEAYDRVGPLAPIIDAAVAVFAFVLIFVTFGVLSFILARVTGKEYSEYIKGCMAFSMALCLLIFLLSIAGILPF